MTKVTDYFQNLWRQVVAPKVDDAALAAHLTKIRERLPPPVFWLLGKAQAGKTSLIRALTGSSDAEIGNGFVPCTKTSRIYPFPGSEDALIQFLDTRGLGEVSYDPSPDLAANAGQSHLLIVVMKALDLAQGPLLDALRKIVAEHPEWPIIVLQTCLHEGYARPDSQHLVPYPFREAPDSERVPADLRRALAVQRSWFAEGPLRAARVQFVPVDLTLAEDGYEPVDYGLPEVWLAIEQALPRVYQGMVRQLRDARGEMSDLRFRAAHPHVIAYALASGAAAGIPAPFVDVPLVLAIQAKMFHTIASLYEQEMNRERWREIVGAIGLGLAGRMSARELMKIIPGVGSAVSAIFAGATTYALGRALCFYFSRFRDGDLPDPEKFRTLFDQEFVTARQRFAEYWSAGAPDRESDPRAPTKES